MISDVEKNLISVNGRVVFAAFPYGYAVLLRYVASKSREYGVFDRLQFPFVSLLNSVVDESDHKLWWFKFTYEVFFRLATHDVLSLR
uniref:Bestrophin homolog n=1 Tax=Parascaris equorum TaxID=6256 RepID=A0A914R3D6_PAREQ